MHGRKAEGAPHVDDACIARRWADHAGIPTIDHILDAPALGLPSVTLKLYHVRCTVGTYQHTHAAHEMFTVSVGMRGRADDAQHL